MKGWNYQKGYIGASRSERAEEALESGEAPLSHWSKAALVEAIAESYGEELAEKASKCSKAGLQRRMLERTSWHHIGKYYNRVMFYSLIENDPKACEASLDSLLLAEKEEKTVKEEKGQYYLVSFEATEWYGQYRRWRQHADRTYFSILKAGLVDMADTVAGTASKADMKDKKDIHRIPGAVTYYEGKKAFFHAIKKACGKESADSARKAVKAFEKKTGLIFKDVN